LDTLTVLTDSYLWAGHALCAEGSLLQAAKYYTAAMGDQPKHIIGSISLALMQMQNSLHAQFYLLPGA